MRKSHAGMAKQTKGRRLQISVPSSPFGWLVLQLYRELCGQWLVVREDDSNEYSSSWTALPFKLDR
jgi:hypothetical protein